jgi:sulfate adenylyltransferase subunit 2
MSDYKWLESESIFVIREAYNKVKNLALLWSMGKDSTVLMHLVRKAFVGHFPLVVLHIDTGYDIPELIAWRDEYVKRHGLQLIVGKNEAALASGMGPSKGCLECCTAMKTQALMDTVRQHDIQGLLVGIRRDEEGSRSKERVVSPRSEAGTWRYKNQPAEVGHYYNLHLPSHVHLRIHPLLNWTEIDIWQYVRRESLEIPSQYFAVQGLRYRSLGCLPCTAKIESTAMNVDEIIAELKTARTSERASRAQDQASAYAMQELRSLGHM